MVYEIDSQKLRALRATKFLTREELSAKSRLSKSLITKLEAPNYHYKSGVRLQTVRALAKALRVNPASFASLREEALSDRQAS